MCLLKNIIPNKNFLIMNIKNKKKKFNFNKFIIY